MSEMDLFRKALEERRRRQNEMAEAEGMRKVILKELEEIEKSANVRILHCVESGSRAWGFASEDSDYDVRFIYVRPIDFYLRLDEKRDFINWQLDDTLDINGWDISKALTLLHKSNPTLFEWNASPIVYKTTDEWQEISKIIDRYFVPKFELYHYFNMAKSTYDEHFKGEKARLKKYFYVLRPLLACIWILAEHTSPPMEFNTLVEKYLPEDMKPQVQQLLDMKVNTPEISEIERIDRLDAYIQKTLAQTEDSLRNMPIPPRPDFKELNEIFRTIVKG